jgi:hypothetical protein
MEQNDYVEKKDGKADMESRGIKGDRGVIEGVRGRPKLIASHIALSDIP